MKRLGLSLGILAALAGLWAVGRVFLENPYVAKGRALYAHYCSSCHGEHGRPNEGYNWAHMPDPRPKDLSNKEEMGTFKDEELFAAISREMKDTTPEIGDKIGEEEFAVPTMPTFKYTLSPEETWAVVAYVRTLHGLKLQVDVAARKKALEETFRKTRQEKSAAVAAQGEAESHASPGSVQDPKQTALEQARIALTNFTERPKPVAPLRPDLAVPASEAASLAELGKRLYTNKYGCNACHRVGGHGGMVGPALDRVGFRLNPTWAYRWIKYPQAMKPDTRMPNLGLSDADAKAVTTYLATLRAPRSRQPLVGHRTSGAERTAAERGTG